MVQHFYKASDGKNFDNFTKCIEHEFHANEAISSRYPYGVAAFNKFGNEIKLNVVSVFAASILVIFDWIEAEIFFEPFRVANVATPNCAGVFIFDTEKAICECESKWKQSSNPTELFVHLMKNAGVY